MDLTLVTGPMFAGKTTYIMDMVDAHSKQSDATKIILVTHSTDDRYSEGDSIMNHDKKILHHKVFRVNELSELNIDFDNLSNDILLCIDEAQFFPNIVEYIRNIWNTKLTKNVKVIVCGLSGDFQQNPFGVEPNWISQLISMASHVLFLKSRCVVCGGFATFTIRDPNLDKEKIMLVGGSDIYKPVCKDHIHPTYVAPAASTDAAPDANCG